MARLVLTSIILVAASPALAQPDDWSYRNRHDGVHLRILNDYHLAENATSREPIVVIGGTATIDGRAEHDVTVIAGTLKIGPKAVILGDVVTVAGEAIIDPAAQIAGDMEHASIMLPDVTIGFGSLFDGWWPFFRLGATLLRLLVIFVVALLLTVVAPRWIDGIAHQASTSPVAAIVGGVAGQILFVPAMVAVAVALAISIVGIPLLLAFPFLLGGAAILWAAGFTAVATIVGARLRGKNTGVSDTPVVDLFTGFMLVSALTVVAHLVGLGSGGFGPLGWMLRTGGWVIEWMTWTVGLGAALAWLFGRRQPAMPPPVPWPTPAPTPS